jgi:hypothetical protein
LENNWSCEVHYSATAKPPHQPHSPSGRLPCRFRSASPNRQEEKNPTTSKDSDCSVELVPNEKRLKRGRSRQLPPHHLLLVSTASTNSTSCCNSSPPLRSTSRRRHVCRRPHRREIGSGARRASGANTRRHPPTVLHRQDRGGPRVGGFHPGFPPGRSSRRGPRRRVGRDARRLREGAGAVLPGGRPHRGREPRGARRELHRAGHLVRGGRRELRAHRRELPRAPSAHPQGGAPPAPSPRGEARGPRPHGTGSFDRSLPDSPVISQYPTTRNIHMLDSRIRGEIVF